MASNMIAYEVVTHAKIPTAVLDTSDKMKMVALQIRIK